MGIKGALKHFPGGDMASSFTGFSKLNKLLDMTNPIDLDTGTLIFSCAIINRNTYNSVNYIPAVREFQRRLVILKFVHAWDFRCIFDGHPPPEKKHEHERRSQKENSIAIASTYIAMCVKVCKNLCIPFCVAPSEADMQVGRGREEPTIAVCRDSDLIAYGHEFIVIVDSYFKEEFRIVNMKEPITEEIKSQYPLYVYYAKYGIKIVHWFAAVMGCDISECESGISYAGVESFLAALASFDSKHPSQLNTTSFAKKLRGECKMAARLTHSWQNIRDEMDRVSKFFTGSGTFYDKDGNIMSLSGKMVTRATQHTRSHMNGNLDPKKGIVFSPQHKRAIQSLKPQNLLHNSAADTSRISGMSLPEGKTSIGQLLVEELKAIVVSRGGSVTGKNGRALNKAQLQELVHAYLMLEKEHPEDTMYFNRSRRQNGVFAKIDTSERQTIPQILSNLVKCNEYEDSIHRFFVDVQQYHSNNKFIDDYNTIALEAPEMTQDFIHQAFIHVGYSTSQKNIASGCTKVLEMNEILYHANAWASDNKSLYIISKQRASQTHDEATRHKTQPGEKPKLKEYLVMAQVSVKPTTAESHGHTLGFCGHVMRSYCGFCTAGGGMCNHRSGLLWMQYLHWGEGRPTPKPPTSAYCTWLPGSRAARNRTTLEPASHTHIERLPTSDEEAKEKLKRGIKKNFHQGIPAMYVYDGDEKKRAKLDDAFYTSHERHRRLFDCLLPAQVNGVSDEDEDE